MPDWKKWLSVASHPVSPGKIQTPHGNPVVGHMECFPQISCGSFKHIVTFQRQSCGSNRSWRQSMIINISFCSLVQPIWRKKSISKSQNRNGFILAHFFRLSKIANLWNHRLLMHLEAFWNYLEANGQHGQVNPWRCQQMTCCSCSWRHSFLGRFSMTGLTYLNFQSQKCLKKYKVPPPSLVDTGSHFVLVAGLFSICSGWHGSIHFSRSERRELKLRESVQLHQTSLQQSFRASKITSTISKFTWKLMINRFQCPDFFTRFSSIFHVFAEDSIGRKPYFLSIRVLFSTYHTPPGSSYNGHAAAWHLQGPRDVLLASVTNHETWLAF